MLCHQILRHFHAAYPCWNSSSKTLLAKLRKKTGYTFANCKKALELHEYNLEKAEKWLNDQAQAMGWSKAEKLEGRSTSQGLVGVAIQHNTAALVEVNCETDFVARNEIFQKIVESTALACLQYTRTQSVRRPLLKLNLSSDDLRGLIGEGGKSLAENLALAIGTVGENLALRRATCYLADDNTLLSGYAHPEPTAHSGVLLGKYGAVVAFKATGAPGNIKDAGQQLSQHIVGMNPLKIGSPGEDIPNSNPDEESCLIHQDFLLDPTLRVGDWLGDTGISVLDFTRFQCGEQVDVPVEKNYVEVAAEVGA
ncbi:elongation factor Ts, mitochondrial isoform X2 [Anabrus simplex]